MKFKGIDINIHKVIAIWWILHISCSIALTAFLNFLTGQSLFKKRVSIHFQWQWFSTGGNINRVKIMFIFNKQAKTLNVTGQISGLMSLRNTGKVPAEPRRVLVLPLSYLYRWTQMAYAKNHSTLLNRMKTDAPTTFSVWGGGWW